MPDPWRLVTWNVRRLSLRDRPRIDRLGALLGRLAPDVVALQEVDRAPASLLAAASGLPHATFVEHAPHAPRGVALCHRDTAIATGGARMPARRGDDKGYTRVLVDGLGGRVELVALHLDWLSRSARTRQIAALADALGPRTSPRVVLGDLNAMSPPALARAHDDTAHALAEALGLQAPGLAVPTFPARAPRWALDWILVSPELRVAHVDALRSRSSDHAALVADVMRAEAA